MGRSRRRPRAVMARPERIDRASSDSSPARSTTRALPFEARCRLSTTIQNLSRPASSFPRLHVVILIQHPIVRRKRLVRTRLLPLNRFPASCFYRLIRHPRHHRLDYLACSISSARPALYGRASTKPLASCTFTHISRDGPSSPLSSWLENTLFANQAPILTTLASESRHRRSWPSASSSTALRCPSAAQYRHP